MTSYNYIVLNPRIKTDRNYLGLYHEHPEAKLPLKSRSTSVNHRLYSYIHMQKETIFFTHNAEVLTHEPFFPARRSPFVVTACPDCTPLPRLINSSWERDPPLPCHSISFSRAPWDADTGFSLERHSRTRTKTIPPSMLRLPRVLFTYAEGSI